MMLTRSLLLAAACLGMASAKLSLTVANDGGYTIALAGSSINLKSGTTMFGVSFHSALHMHAHTRRQFPWLAHGKVSVPPHTCDTPLAYQGSRAGVGMTARRGRACCGPHTVQRRLNT